MTLMGPVGFWAAVITPIAYNIFKNTYTVSAALPEKCVGGKDYFFAPLHVFVLYAICFSFIYRSYDPSGYLL